MKLGSQALAVLTLALFVAFASAMSLPTSEATLRGLSGAAGALIWVVAATGLGGAVLGRASFAEALAFGSGALGLAILPLAGLGMLSPPMLAAVAVAASSAWLLRPEVEAPVLSRVDVGFLLAFGVPALLSALAPPTDTDEIYQHLALPRIFLETGALLGGPLHPDASRPLPIHLLYTGALALGGEAAPKLLHLVWSATLVLAARDMGRRWVGPGGGDLAALALLGSYTFLRELGLAHNNAPVALCVLMALDAALRGSPGRMACLAGMALAGKYTAAPAVAGVFLAWLLLRGRPGLREAPRYALLALAWVAPWWIRNYSAGLHPLFPYTGWPGGERFVFAYIDRYGVGRDWVDFLLLPWNLTVHADTASYAFLGQVSPVGLLCLPAVLAAAWKGGPSVRALIVAALVGFLGWAAGPHWLRYLLPAAPLIALALGAGYALLPGWGRGMVLLGWFAALPANLGPWLGEVADGAKAALGVEAREEVLARKILGWDCVDWINQYSPAEARVALMFTWQGYHIERPYVLGSVEDHVPTRYFLWTQGEHSLDTLRALGVTHILTYKVHFIRKSYPFLDEDTFREQFTESEELLDELLLAESVQVFGSGRCGVWRLSTP